jgi:hypothetical protein
MVARYGAHSSGRFGKGDQTVWRTGVKTVLEAVMYLFCVHRLPA